MSYPVYPPRKEALVVQNEYRQRTYHRQSIKAYHEAKGSLPVPILPTHPEWVEMYWRAWEMAWGNLHRPVTASGFVSNFIDAAFNNNIFMWDTAFMVQFGVYGRRAFNFIQSLDNFYAKQHDDGFIAREINIDAGTDFFLPFDPDATGPNVLAWAEWRYYRISGDEERLKTVFWPLMAFHRWYRANRTWPNGLYWATGLSSGMDNQTRVPDSKRHHRHWMWVDTTMQAALDCAVLEKIAALLNEKTYVAELESERRDLIQKANQLLWNKGINFYQDVGPDDRFSDVKSIGAYWALLEREMVPADRLDGFLQHLSDKEAFNRPHRVPSQAANDPGYDAENGDYWRGGVWSPTNFMLLKGLRRVGHYRLAHKIVCNHLENVYQVYAHTDTFWENYAPETAVAGNPARPNFVGWTGLSPIAMLFEDVIGLWVDWPLRRVIWYRYLDTNEHYGVQNYPLGTNGTLTLIGNNDQVVVTTNVPFTLTIRDAQLNLQAPIAVGTTEIALS